MKSLWDYLNGKKAAIGAFAGPILTFLANRQYLKPDTIDLLTILLGVWVGTAIAHKAIKAKGVKNACPRI